MKEEKELERAITIGVLTALVMFKLFEMFSELLILIFTK